MFKGGVKMIELPEARVIARDLEKKIKGKKIVDVGGNYTDHKFTFYYGKPDTWKKKLIGKKITNIIPRNFYVEIEIEEYKLVFRDGTNIRYFDDWKSPERSKLLIEFDDGSFINVTVQMYGCIALFKTGEQLNDSYSKYYQYELDGIGVLDKRYTQDYFMKMAKDNEKLSAKALLATEQRILGIGNGVVQDILFNARIHPKRKIKDLTDKQIEDLYNSSVETINKMIDEGGRDTEKNIYGEAGRYKTILCSKTYKNNCPKCSGIIKKENYLGGSIYYCPSCQK